MTRIEFVYFDLGNVLVSFDPEIACANVSQLAGVSVDQARAAVYESGAEEAYERGELTSAQFGDQVREHLGLDQKSLPQDPLLVAIADMFRPIESMVEVASFARKHAGRIGVLSNTCPAHWDWVRRQPWAVSMIDFDVQVLSFEVGSMKPDHVIYEQAEEQSRVAPDKILFIDDKPDNIDAARKRGWTAEQCVGGDAAKRLIEKRLKR